MTVTPAQRDIDNLKLHGAHIRAIATNPTPQRNLLLKHASPSLVKALATALRLLNTQRVPFPAAHARRARRMISRNTAERTKKVLVSGEPGKVSRGGGFWKNMSKKLVQWAPALVPAGLALAGGVAAHHYGGGGGVSEYQTWGHAGAPKSAPTGDDWYSVNPYEASPTMKPEVMDLLNMVEMKPRINNHRDFYERH